CDPEDRNCNCPGKVYCGDTKTGSGASCTSGGKTFYETCLVKETCIDGMAAAGGYVTAYHPSYTYVRPYCTTQTGKVLNLYATCTGRVEGINGKCYGKKQCPDNDGYQSDGSTTPCSCDGFKWFDKCVSQSCNYGEVRENGGVCLITDQVQPGWYYIKAACQTSGGDRFDYKAPCTGMSCEGNKGPCYGKTQCSSGTIAVDPCTCGNYTYGSSCVVKCPYEQTAADCKAGQSFTQRCKDNAGTWYGECK
ncbi:MAG: hypothetical protein Q4F75_02445, partial [Pseudomonadota bacterium]|nr:hypothetical protein [Pseudomonadota bacterium]